METIYYLRDMYDGDFLITEDYISHHWVDNDVRRATPFYSLESVKEFVDSKNIEVELVTVLGSKKRN